MSYFPDYALGTRGWEHQVKPGREVCNLGRKVTCSAEADPGALAMPDLSHLNFNPALGSKPNQLDRPTFIVRDRLNGRNRRIADIPDVVRRHNWPQKLTLRERAAMTAPPPCARSPSSKMPA